VPQQVRACIAIAVVAAISAISPRAAVGRTAALAGSWSAVKSDLLDWPSHQFGLSEYLGPFGGNLYIVPGLSFGHDSGADVTSLGAYLDLHYMLPTGDRLIPFIEGGVIGTALRIDVIDRTGAVAARDRTTYLRGGFQIGAGFDLALGSSWSVTAGFRTVRLGDVDSELVLAGEHVVDVETDPSYWELPRVAIAYWY
jgi:hypothetical protein